MLATVHNLDDTTVARKSTVPRLDSGCAGNFGFRRRAVVNLAIRGSSSIDLHLDYTLLEDSDYATLQ